VLENDDSTRLLDAIAIANDRATPLCIQGSGSKTFLGPAIEGSLLSTVEHRGVLDYRPEELYLTARCGTPIADIRNLLRQQRQRLAFDPPEFEGLATFGGVLAAGLAGPGRPWYGAVRDSLLGVVIINGLGDRLSFGGQVMKNVAGYDVTRLMAGSFGTLGVLLEATIRVAPVPDMELDCEFELSRQEALDKVIELSRSALPVTATCHRGGSLSVRFSGNSQAVNAAVNSLGVDCAPSRVLFWNSIRDHSHDFFRPHPGQNLYRFSLPPAAGFPVLEALNSSDWLTEWGGSQRWLWSDAPGSIVFHAAQALGGYAHQFFSSNEENIRQFSRLTPAMTRYHQRLKQAFDPSGILNPHRLSTEF